MIVTQPPATSPTFTSSTASEHMNPGPVGSTTPPAGPDSTPPTQAW